MQTRKRSRNCGAGENFWQDLVEHVDKRINEFKQKDLKGHYNLLRKWKEYLGQTSSWYSTSTDKFSTLVGTALDHHAASIEVKGRSGARRLCGSVRSDDAGCGSGSHTSGPHPDSSKRTFVLHQCGKHCFLDLCLPHLNISPLHVPLMLGWQRQVYQRPGHLDVVYVAPCQRKLRSLDEIRAYLDRTGAEYLMGCHFTIDPGCNLLSTPYDPKGSKVYLDDISLGKETTPISCVNHFSHEFPSHFNYMTKCTIEPNVRSATPTNFLVGCGCEDNCADRTKCSCWRLTLEEAELVGNSQFSVGYVHHRLKRPQHSAVYECHSACGCGRRCSNRVVQGGVRHRLQVYHTGNPRLGWAVRTLDDIPEGSFVCSYVGHIHTEVDADKVAAKHGDEYFADLDYMEVVERHKPHYEAAVRPEPSSVGVAQTECNYRFAHKVSVCSNSSSLPLSSSVTPRESVGSGRPSTSPSKVDSSAGSSVLLSRDLSPLSSLSSLSPHHTHQEAHLQGEAMPLTPPKTTSTTSSGSSAHASSSLLDLTVPPLPSHPLRRPPSNQTNSTRLSHPQNASAKAANCLEGTSILANYPPSRITRSQSKVFHSSPASLAPSPHCRSSSKTGCIPCPLYMALSPGHTPPNTPPGAKSNNVHVELASAEELLYLPLDVSTDEDATCSRISRIVSSCNSKSPRTRGKGQSCNKEKSPMLPNQQPSSQAISRKSPSGFDLPKEKLSLSSCAPFKPPDGHTVESNGAAEKLGHKFRTRCSFQEEFVYFMDAKDKGNVGRFLNHSCCPNLFVQNVFVDSHDLRFPWVAFFAARRISAMEELTWDYNYEVGSVENKVIHCLCGAANCRKRLL